jgi:hypothetical protein
MIDMAGIKKEAKFYFPEGHIWVLMDDEWGVEISGENGLGGELTTLSSWDFNTREAWIKAGELCENKIQELSKQVKNGTITEEGLLMEWHSIDEMIEGDPELKSFIKWIVK